ncbi:hypothetical protein Vadar_006432 [Vaccinium darrowii]|uniref:Uncharacterized protein n=1 Tax=Vaccinium darrowii TaxID=229202 RepID=A0ACB7Z245_9ERIC|nr:hypothetical protein Vadar_006432 [Vaccinium darrowii]
MAPPLKALLVPILLTFFTASASATSPHQQPPHSTPSLPTRLKLDTNGAAGSTKCWDSLFELQSCSNEVVLFFLNGETYLSPGCCDAIRTIENQCWPSMLGSLGFTAEEGGILHGYCDAAESESKP